MKLDKDTFNPKLHKVTLRGKLVDIVGFNLDGGYAFYISNGDILYAEVESFEVTEIKMFDLYVDGNWNDTYPLEKILSVAKQFLQFGCNIEIKQDDEMPNIRPFMFNQQPINTTFPYEVTH